MPRTEIESQSRLQISSIKSASFRYSASAELSALFKQFNLMCNDAIRIAICNKPRSKFALIRLAYLRLKEYGLHTHYIMSACEVAFSVCKNKNRKKTPYIRRAFVKLDNQSYTLNHLLLRIPTRPRSFIFLTLHGSAHHLSLVDDSTLRRGSVTITEEIASIAFSKEVFANVPLGRMGVDINERNVTVSASNSYSHQFNELAEVVEIKERYKEIRTKIGKITRHDNRIGKQLLGKYGRRETNRTLQRIHRITKEITDYAEQNRFLIKMEALKGIRRLYKRGSRQGTSFRGRMNTWVFGETQRQTDYKAAWLGVPVYYVSPRGTSRHCPDCGSRVVQLQDRKLFCAKCDKIWDRDDLASRNIMACVVPQARPPKGSNEKEPPKQDDAYDPLSRWDVAKPGVETTDGRRRTNL